MSRPLVRCNATHGAFRPGRAVSWPTAAGGHLASRPARSVSAAFEYEEPPNAMPDAIMIHSVSFQADQLSATSARTVGARHQERQRAQRSVLAPFGQSQVFTLEQDFVPSARMHEACQHLKEPRDGSSRARGPACQTSLAQPRLRQAPFCGGRIAFQLSIWTPALLA
jgi:hypothetical protein